MPSASPAFHFTGLGSLEKASFSPGATFHATLDDLANVGSIAWSVAATDETGTVPTLTTSGPKGSSVSGVVGAAGTAGLLQATINAGIDPQTGQPSAAMTATAKWYVPTAVKGLEVGCVGEEMQSSPQYGSTAIVNAPIRALDAVAGGYLSDLIQFPDGANKFAIGQLSRANAGVGNAARLEAQAGSGPNDGGRIGISGGSPGDAAHKNGVVRIDLGPVASGDGLTTSLEINPDAGVALTLTYDGGSISSVPGVRCSGGVLSSRLLFGQEVGFESQFGCRQPALADPGAMAVIDWAKGNTQRLGPISANCNPLTFTGAIDGYLYTIAILQDGVGGWAVTWGTSFKFGLFSNVVDVTASASTVWQFVCIAGNLVATTRNVY